METKLTNCVHSVPLKSAKYCGRISWDASGKDIAFSVEVAKKKKQAPRRVSVPIMETDTGEIVATIDLGNVTPLVIAKINFSKSHDEFDQNFYHPDFPICIQELVTEMLTEDGVLRKRLEEALSS